MSDYDPRDYHDDDRPTGAELARLQREHVEWAKNRETNAKVQPTIEEFVVGWDDLSTNDVAEYRAALDGARNEGDVQKYLQANPSLLIQHLGGGHGRWVIPQKRLGAEFVPDFMIAEKSSLGFEWTAVELESPTAKMFTKAGDFTATLNHAIRQIQDWRGWLLRNQAYADRGRDEHGLGLRNIDGQVPGLILIGRRDEVQQQELVDRRKNLGAQLNIKIHSFDWIGDVAQAHVRQRP